jgi:N-ethylmaleimide reductase
MHSSAASICPANLKTLPVPILPKAGPCAVKRGAGLLPPERSSVMKHLLAPAAVGGLALRNHVVMAPLTRQRASVEGVPMPYVADYYAQRASAGLIIAEGTQPSFAGQGYCRTPGIHTPEQAASWRRVTDAVHAKGGSIFLQIMHAGRIAHTLNRQIPDAPVAPSALQAPGQMWTDQLQMQPHTPPRALETAEIPGVVAEFAAAAQLAIASGFDGVEVHAANGYLLNQFLATNTNQRTDGYGGSLNGRLRAVVETVEAVAGAIGWNRTAIRVSPGHMFNDLVDEAPLETHIALLDALKTGDMAYTHIMLPHAFAEALNNAGPPDAILPALRPYVKGPLMAAGLLTPETADALLASGAIDLAAFGRPFIANPDYVARFTSGKPLAEPDQSKFYTPGPEGYSDYPVAA